MKKYKVHVEFIEDFDNIKADDEEEAWVIASDYAIKGGSWYIDAEEIKDNEE